MFNQLCTHSILAKIYQLAVWKIQNTKKGSLLLTSQAAFSLGKDGDLNLEINVKIIT